MEGLPQSFFDAIQYFAHSGDVACLLAPQRMLLGVHNINGDTALHTAILGDNTNAALAFVRVMATDDLNVVNADGQTALHLALTRGNVTVAHGLCTRGARSDIQDAQGNTPLHLATTAALARAVLTAGPQPLSSVLNANGLSPLHVAAAGGRVDVVLELVARQGMDVNSADLTSGRTALHHAVRARNRAICELLLEYEADPNAEDHSGYTPLHAAVQYDLYDIAKLLIDFGADALAQNAYFQSPHDLALHYGSTEAYLAIESFPSIRTPTKNLLSVATSLFGLAAVTGPQPQQKQQTQHTVPAVTAVTSAPLAAKTSAAPIARTSAPPAADRKSSSVTDGGDEWQVVNNEDLSAGADVEWHLHRNKKLPGSGIAKDIQKIFNSKRSKLSKDKDPSSTSSASIARRPATAPGIAAPLSAKAEKAKLAQQYGVPDIAVAQPSSMTASEEKRSLERKYAPKIELDVVDQKRKTTAGDNSAGAASLKAAEAAAQHTPRQLSKFDELSTLD